MYSLGTPIISEPCRAAAYDGHIAPDDPVVDFSPEEAEMARAMIRLAGSVTLLVDSSKFGKPAPFTVAGFGSIDCMVCDEAPDG